MSKETIVVWISCGLPDALYTPEKEPAVAAQEYGEKYRLTPLT